MRAGAGGGRPPARELQVPSLYTPCAFRWDAYVSNQLGRLPLLRRLLLGLASLVLVVASLGIDQTASSRGDARHLGFGYPLHFVSSDFTIHYGLSAHPQTVKLNPWENPVQGNPVAFLASWGARLCRATGLLAATAQARAVGARARPPL